MKENKDTRYKWGTLAAACMSLSMSTVDAGVISVALPRLVGVFETEISVALWVNLAFLLTCSGFMLIAGRIGDVFGRKRVFILGIFLFNIGLVLCGLSQNIIQLILFRIIQGASYAMIVALSPAIVTAAFPDSERGKSIGILTAAMSAGTLTGPVLGGFLLETFDWTFIFYARAPIGIIALIMAWTLLREQRASHISSKFDLWGAVTVFGSLSCLLLFINLGTRQTFVSPPVLILAVSAIILIALFILRERKTEQPVVDLNLFKNKLFVGGNISMAIMGFGFAIQMFLVPFYLINASGYSSSDSGLILTAPVASRLAISPLSGWLSDRIGSRLLCAVGMVLLCLGLFLISRLSDESSTADIVLRLVLFGIGMGTFMPPNQSMIMGTVSKDRLGTASAMMATMRMTGSSSGTAIAGAIFTSRQSFHAARLSHDNLDPPMLDKLSLIGGFRDTFLVTSIVCSIGIFTSLIGAKKQRAK